jgi:hypothetical protein
MKRTANSKSNILIRIISMDKKKFASLYLLAFAFLFFGCQSHHPANTTPVPIEQPPSAQPVYTIEKLFEDSGVDESLEKEWLRFTKSGRYRIAQPEDFKFHDAVKDKYNESDFFPHRYDFWCRGFVAIVIDTRKNSPANFGVICFPNRWDAKTDKIIYQKPVWLCRNENLSRSVLSRASCHQYVFDIADDGSKTTRLYFRS